MALPLCTSGTGRTFDFRQNADADTNERAAENKRHDRVARDRLENAHGKGKDTVHYSEHCIHMYISFLIYYIHVHRILTLITPCGVSHTQQGR